MPRRMSCSMTIDAVRNRTKTVTRRQVDTWRDLKPGDRLTLIEKGMGLPKGSKQVVITEVEIVSNEVVDLDDMDQEECVAEGFPDLTPGEFIDMWCESHGVRQPYCYVDVRRIEWRYLDQWLVDQHRLGGHMWHTSCPLCPDVAPSNVVYVADCEIVAGDGS